MARDKTPEDVELARIKASLEKARLICDTIRWCVLGALGTICVGVIAWATVTLVNKPAWLVFALALIGVGGGPSLLAWRLYLRLRHRLEGEQPVESPPDPSPTGPEEVGGR